MYRVKQFIWAITAGFRPIDYGIINKYLTKKEKKLFKKLKLSEQQHSIRVCNKALKYNLDNSIDKNKLAKIALLHDVGKIDINPMYIHINEEDMNHMERLEYRRHPILGYERLAAYNELSINVLKGVLSHHERCDGSGYPLCLKEDKITNIAKIIGLADTYDKLKTQHNVFEVIKILETQMIRKLDIHMLLQFCSNIMNYYVGAMVVLNTNEIGEIVFIQSQALHRPIIKVRGEHINLYEKTHLEIVRVI